MVQHVRLFFQNDTFLDIYQKINILGFWISLPIIFSLTYTTLCLQKKYKRQKNEIKKNMYSAGMEDMRWLLKHQLKKHQIDVDEDWHKNN